MKPTFFTAGSRALWRVGPGLLLFVMLITGCRGQFVEVQPDPGLPTDSPAAQQTQPPPSATPWQTATPFTGDPDPNQQPGSDWASYSQFGVTFAYPPRLQEQAPGLLDGPDGAVRVETMPNDGAGPGALCQGEANRGKPGRYGAFPQIIDRRIPEPGGATAKTAGGIPACLILPSADQAAERNGEATLLAWLPDGKLLTLRAGRGLIFPIANSMRLASPLPAVAESVCDYNAEAAAPGLLEENGLRLDEFAVASGANCNPFANPVEFSQNAVEDDALARADELIAWQWSGERLGVLNQQLFQFGYRVRAAERLFTVTRGGQIVSARFSWLGRLSISANGQDFVLPVVDSYNMDTSLLRAAGLETSDEWNILIYDRVFPVFMGDDLLDVAYDYERYPRPVNSPALLHVKKNGAVIDTLSVSGSTAAGGAARGLWSWDGHWVVELPGLLVKDGALWNDELGVSEMFAFRVLAGKPFYFFRDDGKIHLSWDGQTLSASYDEVIYQPQALMGNLLQMQSYPNGLTFYARRGDTWYWVMLEAK